MTRRIPVLATAVVLAAAATMVSLGVWQLQRKEWKDALIARYEESQQVPAAVPWPRNPAERQAALFRRSSVDCVEVLAIAATAGRSAQGQTGWSHEARCRTARGGQATVALGWSTDPQDFAWGGGRVAGTIAPAGEAVKLVAARPPTGLSPLAAPDPRDIPNNHLAYAVQWFVFALTAIAVYWLALRRRWRDTR